MLRLNESGLEICNNYYVEQLVNYVRKNDYPNLKSEQLFFGVERERYALCSELDTSEMGFAIIKQNLEQCDYNEEEGEYLGIFDGGVFLVKGCVFYVLVDGHLYLFDF